MAHLTPWKVLAAAAISAAAVGVWAATPRPTPGNVFRAGETAVVPVSDRFVETALPGQTDSGRDAPTARPRILWRVLDATVDSDEEIVLASGEAPDGSSIRIPHASLGGKFGAFVLEVHPAAGASDKVAESL